MKTDRLELNGLEQTQIGCRSGLYSLISKGFRFPAPERYESLKKGQFADEVQKTIAHLPCDGLKGGELGRGIALSDDEFQGAGRRLFPDPAHHHEQLPRLQRPRNARGGEEGSRVSCSNNRRG